jgi:glycosyltransferase involved in cell wall biosynthesis
MGSPCVARKSLVRRHPRPLGAPRERRYPRCVQVTPLATVIVPAYQEHATLAAALARLCAYLDQRPEAIDVVVVDDGSADETYEIARAQAGRWRMPMQVLRHDRNRGLAEAIRTGVAAAHGASIITIDADLSYAPPVIGDLLAARARTHPAVAIASPYMRGGTVSNVPFVRLAASRCANALLSARTGGALKTLTGLVRCYDAAFVRDALTRGPRGEINAWLALEALRLGRMVVEVPVHLEWPAERRRGASRISSRGLLRRTKSVIDAYRSLGPLALEDCGRRTLRPTAPSRVP